MQPLPHVIYNEGSLFSPVVVAVSHAGRNDLRSTTMLRVPVEKLRALEDRYADALAQGVIDGGIITLVARTPRLWIDLNRAETELDPAMIRGSVATGAPLPPRVRGGLGLIPRRLAQVGEIWRGPLERADIEARLEIHYRPWHDALSTMLQQIHDRFGAVLLIDLHSMPPLEGPDAPAIVIGDRFGRSASPQLTAAAEAIVQGNGFKVAINTPYAGGHTLDRHSRPHDGIHALQIEIDRRTYLDPALDRPGQGLGQMQGLIAELVARLGDELMESRRMAAE